MGLFDRLKGLKADYDTRKAEEAKLSEEEGKLVKDYNLQRTGQTGRYLVGGDRVIDVNLRNPDSVKAVREVLDKRDVTPTLRRISPKQAKEFTKGAGGGIGNFDFTGGGFGGDYDFFGGGTSKPRKRKSSGKRKKR